MLSSELNLPYPGCYPTVIFSCNDPCLTISVASLPSRRLQTHLALYCFANGQVTTSLKLLYRARYLMLLVCGEDHPEMALLDVSDPPSCCMDQPVYHCPSILPSLPSTSHQLQFLVL